MKCVREDFCDANGVMVPFRVSLTDQEKRERGTLIVSNSLEYIFLFCLDRRHSNILLQPCMQPSGSFAVCCTAPQQQETRDSIGAPALQQQQLTRQPDAPAEVESVPAEQQLQQQQLTSTNSCPVLNTLPPLAECQGRTSNCWSPGVRDLDCLESALCCFDGCANVCQGKGAKSGNGLVPEKKGPAGLPASSPLLQPLIKSPTKADLQAVPKPQQDQPQPLIKPRPNVQAQIQSQSTAEYNPPIPSSSQLELDAALGELAKALVAESRPRPAPIDDRIVYPEPLANNRYPRRPTPSANPSPTYEELLVVADQMAAQKNAQRPNNVGQHLIQKPEYIQTPSEKTTHGSGYGGRPILKKPAAQFVEANNDRRPTQFVEAVQSPALQNSPKLQIQTQPAVQQPTYQPKPQFNGPVLTSSPVGGQPSRVKAASPEQSEQGAAALPFTQCPSAMKCVEKRVCDFNGVMRDFVTTLSPAQESLRVPLIVSPPFISSDKV